jgi:phosphotransferase system  glucose/maltose/N-acetylglucosamine-specific IIC component
MYKIEHTHHIPLMENMMANASLMMFGPMGMILAMKAAAAKTKRDREKGTCAPGLTEYMKENPRDG